MLSTVVALIVAAVVSVGGSIVLRSESARSYFESIDIVMIFVGFVLAVAKFCYDIIEKWQFNQQNKARTSARESGGIEDVEAYEVKPEKLDTLILIMPKSNNLTPLYLLNYFRPKKVAFIWSADEDCIRYTNCLARYLKENVDDVACSGSSKNVVYDFLKDKEARFETDVMSYPASSSKVNLESVNYYMVNDVEDMIRRAYELISLIPVDRIGIDITSATSICSIAAFVAADKYGLSPVYLHASQKRVAENLPDGAIKEFVHLQDVQALIGKGTSTASDRGITIFEVWWTKYKDYMASLIGR